MATRILQGEVDNDFNNTANWSGATVPVSGDKIVAPNGNYVITTNVDRSGTTTHFDIIVEDEFSGQIGTSAAPLKVSGASDSTLKFNAPNCQNFHFNGAMSAAYILATYPSVGAVSIQGGTTALLVVSGGRGLQLGAGMTCTKVVTNGPGAQVEALAGNTITDAFILQGEMYTYTTVTNTYIARGTAWFHGSSKTYAKVETWDPVGRAMLQAPSSTFTKLNAYAGTMDARKGEKTITITNAECWALGRLLYGGHVVETNAPTIYGGIYSGHGAPDFLIPIGGQGV